MIKTGMYSSPAEEIKVGRKKVLVAVVFQIETNCNSHIAVLFIVDTVNITFRSRVAVCTDSVTLTLPASSFTK